MKKLPQCTVIAILIQFVLPSSGSVESPYRHIVASEGSDCFAVVNPGETTRDAKVICYRANEEGGFTELWSYEGEFSPPGTIFLLEDGKHMIRFAKSTDLPEAIVIECYNEGRVRYTTEVKKLFSGERGIDSVRIIRGWEIPRFMSDREYENVRSRFRGPSLKQYLLIETDRKERLILNPIDSAVVFKSQT